ncbi:PEP-CTERM sorting domain-containing protein [Pseudomonadota bacterium]
MKIKFTHAVMAGVLFLLCGGTSYALPVTYTDHTDFFNDLTSAGLGSTTLDFDGLLDGQIIADGESVAGITFHYDFGGVQMMASNIFDTTSPRNFLGTDDGDVFLDGDSFGLSFSATHAIGMYFLAADEMEDDDIRLIASTATASLIKAAVQQTLADGSDVYFLGIIDDVNTFQNASVITPVGGGHFFYNIDDITVSVPEPGTTMLILIGMLGALKRKLAN